MRGRALLGAALALAIWPPAAAAQHPPEAPLESLSVQTVPKIEGARFVLNGRTFRTDANGRVTVPGDGQPGLRDRVEIPETTIARGMRVQFSRRTEEVHLLNRLYRVRLSFVDLQGRPIAASSVTLVTLKGSHGDRVKLRPGKAQWLQGARIVPFKEGFREKRLTWVVEEAIVNGQNVVNKNQQRFEPYSTRDFRITLLYYPAHITVRDALFGFPTGSRVILKHPNGKVERHRLGPNGDVRVPSLPRGEYIVTVEGAGLSFEQPLTLSRKQVVDLQLLSYLDLAVGGGVLGSIAVGLLLLGGRPLPRPSRLIRRIPRLKTVAVELRDRLTRDVGRFAGAMPAGLGITPDERWSWEFHLDFGHLAAILRQHGGAYIGWEGDLPKTLGACSIIEALEARCTLVVCPNTAKKPVWAAELRRLLPAHDIRVLPKVKSKRDAMLGEMHVERHSTRPMVMVVPYEALAIVAGKRKAGRSMQIGECWRRLGEWDLVVADEAHRIWDTRPVMSRALERVPSKHRLALSGSAVQNHAEELFGVLPWLFPEVPGVVDAAVVCRARWNDSGNGHNKLAIGVIPAQLETLRREQGTFEVYRRTAAQRNGELI